MITPRRTRLVRVPDLRRFQQAIALTSIGGSPFQTRRTAVLVPSSGAAATLRHTLEDLCLVRRWRPSDADVEALEAPDWPVRDGDPAPAVTLPHIVTRSGLYELLRERLPDAPVVLGRLEREVLLERLARETDRAGVHPPFAIRPALVSAMLDLYDGIRRHLRTVDDFERLMGATLESGATIDRGARRLLEQTRFLAAAFRAYENAVAALEEVDEHGLRAHLIERTPDAPILSVVVTVGDQAASPHGLWPADFDLLARLPGLESLIVIATEAALEAGYLPRLFDALPGIEVVSLAAADRPAPVLLAPDGQDAPFFVSRDREEEVAACARRLRQRPPPDPSEGPVALVYQRPLPYLYLARQVFRAEAVTWEALDALPLAAEPPAAALDVLLSFVTTGFSRSASIALLRTPQLFGGAVDPEAVADLDRELADAYFLGGLDHLLQLRDKWRSLQPGDDTAGQNGRAGRAAARRARALAAMDVLCEAASRLAPLAEEHQPSVHLDLLERQLRELERVPEDPLVRARHLRASAAVYALIARLRDACIRFDDYPRSFEDTAALLRRLVEEHTFSPRVGPGFVHLVDADAAPYGAFSDVTLVGVVEGEWPASGGGNIFYPGGLLRDLGWPNDTDRRTAARAAFDDLLRLPSRSLALSTFSLEDDALVRPSAYVEDLERSGLEIRRIAEAPARPGLAVMPLDEAGMADAMTWRAFRLSPEAEVPAPGMTGPLPPRTYPVTGIDRFRQCPFKFFAQDVLRLEEERGDEPGLSAQVRGEFVHEVFRTFFERWAESGRGAIGVEDLQEARTLFAQIVDEHLPMLPASERAIERARLVGSAVGAGLGERAFRFEAARPRPIVERLLEEPIDGRHRVMGEDGTCRTIALRGTADRIDLLADGTLRLLDYKSGKASNARDSLQVQIYGLCAETRLRGRHGRTWIVGDAGYLAFGREEPFVSIITPAEREAKLAEASAKLVETVDRIEHGEFPVQPADLFTCNFCGFAAVCRKDYVGDE